MTRAEEIIAAARARERARRGVRTKIRLPDALAERARACANDVGESLGDWIAGACRWGGRHVANWQTRELATRAGSEALSVRVPEGLTPGEVRACIAACCAYCEARRVTYTPQPVRRYRVTKWT
jgi:hypothetical protein